MYNPTKPYKEQITDLIKQTWETPFVSVSNGIVVRKFSFPDFTSVDGIGTKGVYHWNSRTFKSAVIDALAMNLNDLALQRATPYMLTDHIILPKEDEPAILEIMKYLVDECKERNIAIISGETAVHNEMNGLELSVAISGFVKKRKLNRFRVGDILIGIESNGIHSNGFTKIRELFGEEYRKEFVSPTTIYLDTILELDKKFDIHGLTHITGGAFTKLRDYLDEKADIVINRNHNLKPQEIFNELYQRGISDEEMYRTFNCGIGFILGINEGDSVNILFNIEGFKYDIIGEVVSGDGKIKIQSKFSNKKVIY